ncbi:MAG TPA: 4Fe-4S dicluster domain-containing protein [Campylobacterales bacterium]|nr:4Fe-4S dicluster domain-containing protein [Campylobacterales bacterium]HHC11328.1 4Fe-4S dicluster domain-containing protein [Campylobacterales bacterium]HHD81555.1 4Fe-4S dicluster domain-containing protein [Campylobacterales bacterium]
MAVMITDLCINCDSCIDECPATAIVSADDSPIEDAEYTYVKPEKCIECVDSTMPKCADVCPTEGAIVWDMPYTSEYNNYYISRNEEGIYNIRIHKKQGIFSPEKKPKPFREVITIAQREAHEAVQI